MGVLSGTQIARLAESGELVIDPFEERLIQPASYDLRVGPKILASPLSAEILGTLVELNDKSSSYNIQSGQMIGAISAERLHLPLNICGRFGIRSGLARRGLNAFGGVQLDPGFAGRLIMNLLNVGPEPVTLTLGEPIFTVEFHTLEEPASSGYSGPYQYQDDFPEEQYHFILSARTTSLAEIPTLRQEVARLNVLIEELEEKLPDPDEGLVLIPEIEDRLRRSLATSEDSLVSVDDIRRKLGI
jgi:dCTP deaminase